MREVMGGNLSLLTLQKRRQTRGSRRRESVRWRGGVRVGGGRSDTRAASRDCRRRGDSSPPEPAPATRSCGPSQTSGLSDSKCTLFRAAMF